MTGDSMRAMMLPWCVLYFGCMIGCKGDREKSVETVAREPVAASPAGGIDAGADSPAPLVEYTADERARYLRHLAQGRAHAGDRRFADAVREFDQALGIIPMDPRALSEVGWAAFQAGDYDRARAANQDAIRLARDDTVRAASLYNQGRLAESMGEFDEAEEHYRASLALRANTTVAGRLAGMRVPRPAPVAKQSVPACGPYTDADELCRCVLAAGKKLAGGSCQRESRGVLSAELLFAGSETNELVYLVVEDGSRGWSTVALLGRIEDDDARAVHRELEIARFENRTVGAREVLWMETVATYSQAGNATRGAESRKVHSLVLCPRSSDGAIVECRLEIPLSDETETRAPGQTASTHDRQPSGSKRQSRLERDSTHLHVDVRDDGTVKVMLESGRRSDAMVDVLGVHRLW